MTFVFLTSRLLTRKLSTPDFVPEETTSHLLKQRTLTSFTPTSILRCSALENPHIQDWNCPIQNGQHRSSESRDALLDERSCLRSDWRWNWHWFDVRSSTQHFSNVKFQSGLTLPISQGNTSTSRKWGKGLYHRPPNGSSSERSKDP